MEEKYKRDLEEVEQETKRLQYLIRNYKKGRKIVQSTVRLKQPIIILTRRNQRMEWIEPKKNMASYRFIHSDGEEREVPLVESYIHTADYGGNTFKCFLLHEDWAFPMPPKPLVEAKEFRSAVNNAMSAIWKWKAEEAKGKAAMLWAGAAIVAIIIGGVIVYKMVVPAPPPVVMHVAEETAKQVIENATAML